MTTLKDEVSNNKKVVFIYYRANHLWYKTESSFEFPVPIEEIGDATFLAEDRAILFMRYIRKHIDIMSKKENVGVFSKIPAGPARPCVIYYEAMEEEEKLR